MGIFSRSFDKPGPGVDPNAPQKRSFFRFFDIFFRKFWHFIKANLLYLLTLIPTAIIMLFLSSIVVAKLIEGAADVIGSDGFSVAMIFGCLLFTNLIAALWGMGPATAGMTYIMRNYAREEHAWLWSDFKDTFKSNFKQSIAVFAIDIALLFFFYVAIIVYSQMSGLMMYLKYVIYIMILIYTLMHMYIYPMMVTFDMSLKDLYRNSLIFALGKLPSNILVLIILIGVHLGLPVIAILFGGKFFAIMLLAIFILELFVGQAFSLFLINFNVYPKLKQYMMEPSENTAEPALFKDEFHKNDNETEE